MISLMRPVTVMYPSSSIEPRSPVLNHSPSNAAAVASGFFQYSRKTLMPLTWSSPCSSVRTETPGSAGPTVPIFDFSARFVRVNHPARGRDGGADGAAGVVALDDGTAMKPKGWQHVPAGRRLVLKLPGGGGYGDPARRSNAARSEDVSKGYVTEEAE